MEIAPGIVADPNIKGGKPVIKGTRVPVDVVLAKLASGASNEQVQDEYGLSAADIRAALRYAASVITEEEVRSIQ